MNVFNFSREYVSLEFIVLDGSRVVGVDYLEERINELSLNRNSKLSNKVSNFING